MKLGKKLLSGVAVTVACATLATVTAFANTSKKDTLGYGALIGYLESYSSTSVDRNNDNARLTVSASVVDINGNMKNYWEPTYSDIGGTYVRGWNDGWSGSTDLGWYAVYGTHVVAGGNTYGASAVYTYTRL